MAYNGQLNKNEVLVSLYNVIINQRTFTDNVRGLSSSLVERARTEGSMFGDTMLYNSADILQSYEFLPVDETQNGTPVPDQVNVLIQHVPTKINTQAITLDVFRQIPITIQRTLTKRAFLDEGVFSAFISMLVGLLDDTKKAYDVTTYNAYIGTSESTIGEQAQTVTNPAAGDTNVESEAGNRIFAGRIYEKLASVLGKMKDLSKDFNDLGYYRAFSPDSIEVIWNEDYVHYLNNVALPTIFNTGIYSGVIKAENVLNAKYFGTINATEKVADIATRSLVEQEISGKHYFAGELIEEGATVPAGKSYQQDDNIIFKVIGKESVPYMSGFESKTEFINPKNMNSENIYLTFAHNTLQRLSNLPFVTVRKVEA